jgi:hypothetical protein
MSTDDRDIESSNPSKNFKVGDFDQRSGFFTPVWESKRRIRSEPPAPPSSKGESQRSAPSSRAPSRGRAEPPASASPEAAAAGKAAKAAPVPRPRTAAGGKSKARSQPARAATPVPPAPASERPAPSGNPTGVAQTLLPPALAAVFNAPVAPEELEALRPVTGAAASEAPAGVSPQRTAARPSAAARALQEAGPDLPPAAFLDAEPDFRSPPPAAPPAAHADRNPVRYRALRASTAATRVHEQLKAKLQAEAAEIDESRFELDPETHRNPMQGLESAEPDPFPLSLMRRLRRTIRLSTPVPDRVRSLISKYDRS